MAEPTTLAGRALLELHGPTAVRASDVAAWEVSEVEAEARQQERERLRAKWTELTQDIADRPDRSDWLRLTIIVMALLADPEEAQP